MHRPFRFEISGFLIEPDPILGLRIADLSWAFNTRAIFLSHLHTNTNSEVCLTTGFMRLLVPSLVKLKLPNLPDITAIYSRHTWNPVVSCASCSSGRERHVACIHLLYQYWVIWPVTSVNHARFSKRVTIIEFCCWQDQFSGLFTKGKEARGF